MRCAVCSQIRHIAFQIRQTIVIPNQVKQTAHKLDKYRSSSTNRSELQSN